MTKASVRQLRVGELLRRSLTNITKHVLHCYADFAIVSVSKVVVNADLSIASVYLSMVIKNDDVNDFAILQYIHQNSKKIRFMLSKDVILRITPELRFYCKKIDTDAVMSIEKFEN